MDWQQPASLAVVACTGFFFIRHQIRLKRKSRGGACDPDCGCGAKDVSLSDRSKHKERHQWKISKRER